LGSRFISVPALSFRMKFVLISLILFNAGLFSIKQMVVLLSADTRDENQTFRQFSELIPEGSRVIGDEAYYYTAIRNKCDFQYLDRGAAGFQRVDYHLKKFDFQYIVVRNPFSNPTEFNHYRKACPLEMIGEIHSPAASPLIQRFESILTKFGASVPSGYRGFVYKR